MVSLQILDLHAKVDWSKKHGYGKLYGACMGNDNVCFMLITVYSQPICCKNETNGIITCCHNLFNVIKNTSCVCYRYHWKWKNTCSTISHMQCFYQSSVCYFTFPVIVLPTKGMPALVNCPCQASSIASMSSTTLYSFWWLVTLCMHAPACPNLNMQTKVPN